MFGRLVNRLDFGEFVRESYEQKVVELGQADADTQYPALVRSAKKRLRLACEKESDLRARIGCLHGYLPNPLEWGRPLRRAYRNCRNWMRKHVSGGEPMYVPNKDERDLVDCLVAVLHKWRWKPVRLESAEAIQDLLVERGKVYGHRYGNWGEKDGADVV